MMMAHIKKELRLKKFMIYIYRFNKEFRILLTDLLGSIEIAFRT
ncbi:hypothetical protein BN173_3640003 [Clostridioides difficile T11]|nr:hypothetical protein BN173_3640003 [Clostridioides difficile T11]CCL32081.1 hypothetical protein BN174_3330003 [Clostridioides difficile E15]CCL39922.1 hypothetical protein BN176_3190003 [Clostridioides difficile E19]